MHFTFYSFFCLYKIIDLMKMENSRRLEERLNGKKKTKNKKQRTNRSINQIRRPIIYIVSVCHQPGKAMFSLSNGLEAFAVDDSGAGLVVLLLGDPHLLEGGEGSQDGASDPDGVFPL